MVWIKPTTTWITVALVVQLTQSRPLSTNLTPESSNVHTHTLRDSTTQLSRWNPQLDHHNETRIETLASLDGPKPLITTSPQPTSSNASPSSPEQIRSRISLGPGNLKRSDALDELETLPRRQTHQGRFSFQDVLNGALDHKALAKVLKKAGVTLGGTNGVRDVEEEWDLANKWSWTADQKTAFAGRKLRRNDGSGMSPLASRTELSKAVTRERGVDIRNIVAAGHTRISDRSTTETINSIFEGLKIPEDDGIVVLSRSDPDPARKEAFKAFFRTTNGKTIADLLTDHANVWGFRIPQVLVLMKPALVEADTSQFSFVTLA